MEITNEKLKIRLVSCSFCLYDLPCHSLDSAVYDEKSSHPVADATADRRAYRFLVSTP